MLLQSGTESLVTATRRWARDPSTSANPAYDTDADIIPSINVEYLKLSDLVRIPTTGRARKRTYLDGKAVVTPEDHFYPLPPDFLGRLRVEVSTNGSDLSTTLPGSSPAIKILTIESFDVALDHYNIDSGGTTDVKYAFIFGNSFGISTPLTATEAGTRSIRITYEASSPELKDANDEPDLPRPYHDVIAKGAAMRLLEGDDLPVPFEQSYSEDKALLRRSVWEATADEESRVRVKLRTPTTRTSNIGKIRRR